MTFVPHFQETLPTRECLFFARNERGEPVRESTGTVTFERLGQHLFHNVVVEGRLEVSKQIADMMIDFDFTVTPANNGMDD
jgi:seryl-tRNA(Sec) selenium transferase